MIFWGLLALGVIIILVGTIFLSYWIPKRLGYKKLGLVLSTLLTIGCIAIISYAFRDDLYSNSDVKVFLAKHDISLKDDFEITFQENDNILDTYRKFKVEISDADKRKIIEVIKDSDNFGQSDFGDLSDNSFSSINYEDTYSFVRKSIQTFGPHEVPTIEIIQVDKDEKLLTCYKYVQ